jgi:hypothetical protein
VGKLKNTTALKLNGGQSQVITSSLNFIIFAQSCTFAGASTSSSSSHAKSSWYWSIANDSSRKGAATTAAPFLVIASNGRRSLVQIQPMDIQHTEEHLLPCVSK